MLAGDGGITPDQSAERTFAGIQNGDYWILPYPENLDAALRRRVDGILARHAPDVYDPQQ